MDYYLDPKFTILSPKPDNYRYGSDYIRILNFDLTYPSFTSFCFLSLTGISGEEFARTVCLGQTRAYLEKVSF